jgi:hypothetical protein
MSRNDSHRLSKRQQEKAPEGRSTHGDSASDAEGEAPSEHEEGVSVPKSSGAGPAPVESKFTEELNGTQ